MAPAFASPPNLHAFHAQVWDVARQIPPGKVAIYGQIAGLIPPPGGMDPKAYLAFGPRFTSPANQNEFNSKVWDIVRRIPTGKIATYGQIAWMILPPKGVDPKAYLSLGPRWAGSAMEGMKKWKW